ncbi:MAG: argininosuccinate lyase [Ignavibacteriales bacterium]|nr:argininosuccinate lyase [Ignavibacteriales bacterium]
MLWGGRFKEKLNDKALSFSSSLSVDINLILEDLLASKVHAEMLSKVGLITEDESNQIINGLNKIETEWKSNDWVLDENKFEDIHTAVEWRLTELIGESAGKLHTGRSRNDQVATDMKLWIRKAGNQLKDEILSFQKTLVETAKQHTETIIPGYTHLQRAQPISFAFHLLTYVEMLERDKARAYPLTPSPKEGDFKISSIGKRAEAACPLGSGALAGSTLPLDRNYTSEKLGFDFPARNALDAVSDRDFLLDFLNTCSIGMMHLSRLAEEIILWSSAEWKFIKLSDEFATGSSLMPQKKNPDMAELVRGKTGRVFGNQFSLLSTMKSLPLSYNRDLQEDKEPVFDSFNTYINSLSIMKMMIATMEVNAKRFTEELKKDFSLATDLADWLVLKGIPFREAHNIVGTLVRHCEDDGKTFNDLVLADMKEINPIFDETALECLNLETALSRKKTFGSPNPKMVKEQIEFWKNKFK